MSSSSSPPTTTATAILDVENLKAHQGSDQTLLLSKTVELGNSEGKRVHSKSESETGESATGNCGNSNSKLATLDVENLKAHQGSDQTLFHSKTVELGDSKRQGSDKQLRRKTVELVNSKGKRVHSKAESVTGNRGNSNSKPAVLDVENLKAHQGSDQTLLRSKTVELGNSKGKRVHSKSESATGNRGNSHSKPAALDVENLKAHQGSDQTLFRSKTVELGNSKGKRVHSKSESATGNRGNSHSKPAALDVENLKAHQGSDQTLFRSKTVELGNSKRQCVHSKSELATGDRGNSHSKPAALDVENLKAHQGSDQTLFRSKRVELGNSEGKRVYSKLESATGESGDSKSKPATGKRSKPVTGESGDSKSKPATGKRSKPVTGNSSQPSTVSGISSQLSTSPAVASRNVHTHSAAKQKHEDEADSMDIDQR